MAYHCYHDASCPDCDGFYIRFDAGEACPFCGSQAAEVYDLVAELIGSAKLTLAAQGDLDLGPFRPITQADRYVVHAYEALEAYRQVTHLPVELVVPEIVAETGTGRTAPEREHWSRFFSALLERWRRDRHLPVEGLGGVVDRSLEPGDEEPQP